MKNLSYAIRMSMRYKYSIMGSIVCSAMVALFWGANITAVYPFVEVVFQGQTLHDWAAQRLIDDVDAGEDAAADLDSTQHFAKTVLYDLIERYAPRDAFMTLVGIVIFLLAGTLFKSFFRVASLVLVARAAGRTTVDLRNDFFRSMLSDRPKTSNGTVGDAAARVGGDMGSIGAAIQTIFGRSVQEPMKMSACLIGAALVNWRLLLFSLLACPLASFLLVSLARSIRRASLRAFDQKCLLMGRMLQTFQGLQVVKAYNMESHERRRFWDHTNKVFREQLKMTWYEGLIRSNNELLGIGVICLSALAGGYLVLNQQTVMFGIRLAQQAPDFGQIMLFYGFLIGCTDPLRKMADVYGGIQKGAAAADRIIPFVQQAKTPVDREGKRMRRIVEPIRFENVHFHYVPNRPVIRGLSFAVRPGETLAVIGPNGCGKSTLVNLLMRFETPVRGRISIGSDDIQTLRRKNLRRRIALVSQRAILFNDTVFNNIAYGKKRATQEEVELAARKAHAHEFIVHRLPNGYESNCGDSGKRLSGGQQQRIALARAILRDPDLMILDEASSQIDPKSETLINESLREFIKHRTTIMITHRVSTLDMADRILVMDSGRVVDIGTHEELVQRCPIYQALRRNHSPIPGRKIA